MDEPSLQEVLDFLVTEEQLGVTFVTAAIENAPGTPSEQFLPVLRNAVTQEYNHVEALKEAGGKPLTTTYWFPDAAFDGGGVGVFESLEAVETIEVSLYLIGVSAFARSSQEFGARLCAEAMGTEAVHRALVRFAQGELGKEVGPPNDVGFENFDFRTVETVRQSLEELGIGYGSEGSQPGRFYEYPGDPLASGVGTPVTHTTPA
jgi:Ferritin-like domain